MTGVRPVLAHPVKLVVWDLDDTLWQGTLSEGPVDLAPERAEVVRTLNRRGIVNAICSKNEAGAALERLSRAGLAGEFVFPSIDWSPKGARVARLIDDAQLRPENVLFIDDHPQNLEEARHAAPGLQVAGPEIIGHLLALPECAGKDDRGLDRLRQYQVLERKLADRQEAPGSNEAFLRSCDIRVEVVGDTRGEEERLHELCLRTNQLNFTKRRLGRGDFDSLLADPGVDSGFVRVADRYGEYGICGFYAVDRRRHELVDFLFSCRILNMGVEQWLFDRLGRPALRPVGGVVSTLDGPPGSVDWITERGGPGTGGDALDAAPGSGTVGSAPEAARVLMMGGCDLIAAAEFLGGDIATDFSRVGEPGALIHVEHTDLLRQAQAGLTDEQLAVVDRLPFVDRALFAGRPVFGGDYDVLVYSVLMDYTQGRYRHRQTGLVIPWNQLDVDATAPADWPGIVHQYARSGFDRTALQSFAEDFESLGPLSPADFQDHVRWLAGAVGPEVAVIFLNGAEVPFENPDEPERHLRHRTMNAALDEVVGELSNATVCDVRTFVHRPDDLAGDVRHYRRHVYLAMAEAIRTSGATSLAVKPVTWQGEARRRARRTWRRFRSIVWRRRQQLLGRDPGPVSGRSPAR